LAGKKKHHGKEKASRDKEQTGKYTPSPIPRLDIGKCHPGWILANVIWGKKYEKEKEKKEEM
jgi:hypothetical protein